jgi:acid phosphatase
VFRHRALPALLTLLLIAVPAGAAFSAVQPMDHIIVVIMENKNYNQVRSAPYTASLIANGSELSLSFAVTHPSQPNYLILWSGSTQGVTNDVCPPVTAPFSTENFGHALEAAGKTWKAYSEDLPEPASTVCSSGLYLRRHCPWTYWSNLNHYNERPYSDLIFDITFGNLPNLAFVIPNNCDNTHNSGCTVTVGDNWLANNMPTMIQAVGPNGCVILTWDEDDGTLGNHILTVFSGPRIKKGYKETGVGYNHYDIGKTICLALGITPFAGFAAGTTNSVDNIWYDGVLDVPPPPAGELALSAPTPNPTSGEVSARLWLPVATPVHAAVYDLAGHAIRTLADGTRSGDVLLHWDGRREGGASAGAGVYFFKVRAGNRTLERKAILIR